VIFVFEALAVLSFVLTLWQWIIAIRFPLHQRVAANPFSPAVTLLKPLKGADSTTKENLRSWFVQTYPGEVQILFGVASENDPACEVVRELLREFPECDAQLVVCPETFGANAKVSKLIHLLRGAKYELIAISDADVRVPCDFLANAVHPLRDEKVGLVNCFYRFSNPTTLAMEWEATATNADFWSQVLQSRHLKPMDFALGAVMITWRKQIQDIGGFEAIANCLADDYQLGNRIAKNGYHIALSTMVVDCWDSPKNLRQVWKHQLRWARTIRVCQPVPYFFSILSNVTLWALVWGVADLKSKKFLEVACSTHWQIHFCGGLPLLFIVMRTFVAIHLQRRLERNWRRAVYFWLVPLKDIFQALIWLLAFAGNQIEWRGEKYRLRRDGALQRRAVGCRLEPRIDFKD
jgi:ceramide glucosyltransferase